jgi:hypothetical protein
VLTDSSVVVLVSGKVDLKCLGGKQTCRKIEQGKSGPDLYIQSYPPSDLTLHWLLY